MSDPFLLAIEPSIIVRNQEEIDAYSCDRSHRYQPNKPLVVIRPITKEQVQSHLSLAYDNDIPIVVRGAGSGTTGASSAVEGCMLMVLDRLNRCEIDPINNVAICEPGVITGELQKKAMVHSLCYPPDPGSLDYCSIGGNVATNAGGPRCVKYGVTEHYVVGLSGYYPDGTPFRYGGRYSKEVAGLNLKQLLVGSEGTLAVITEVILKLIPQPQFEDVALLGFASIEHALTYFSELKQHAEQPCYLEFLDQTCYQAGKKECGHIESTCTSPYFLIVGFDGSDSHVVRERINQISSDKRVNEVYRPCQSEKIWEVRRSISPGLRTIGGKKVSHDVVVPPSMIPSFLTYLKELSAEFEVHVLGYGHLGDGNIHVNILKNNCSQERWDTILLNLEERIIRKAVDFGGTISGEHGIGRTKKPYLSLIRSDSDLHIMKAIKKAFDPKSLLNPDKVFP